MSTLAYFSITLAALETRPIAMTGSNFRCKASTAAFQMNFDGGQWFDMDSGWSISLVKGESFKNLIIKNTLAKAITVEFYAGTCSVSFDGSNQVRNAPTYFKGSGLQSIQSGADNGQLYSSGVDNLNIRRQFILTNNSLNIDLYICVATDSVTRGAILAVVKPRTAWTCETSSPLFVVNLTDVLAEFCIGETFYS